MCPLQSRDQGEGREFIFGLYVVNNFPYGKLKKKMENEKMRRMLIVMMMAAMVMGFMGCDNGSTSNNEIRVVAPEFRGRFEHIHEPTWFELTETTITLPWLVDPAPAWTVGNELWIFTFDTDSRVGTFSADGNVFNDPGGWGTFTRVTN